MSALASVQKSLPRGALDTLTRAFPGGQEDPLENVSHGGGKKKKVGPLIRQEHPVLAVRVRGMRPYDRIDRRPHFRVRSMCCGAGTKIPGNDPEVCIRRAKPAWEEISFLNPRVWPAGVFFRRLSRQPLPMVFDNLAMWPASAPPAARRLAGRRKLRRRPGPSADCDGAPRNATVRGENTNRSVWSCMI